MANQNPSVYEGQETQGRPLILAIVELPLLYSKALFMPVPETFAKERQRGSWAIVWIQLLLIIVISAVLGLLRGLHRSTTVGTLTGSQALYDAVASIAVGTSLAATLIQVIIVPILFFIGVGIQYLLAKAFRGEGSFLSQAYTALLYQAPLLILHSIISTVLVFIASLTLRIVLDPVIAVALLIYSILLNIAAIAGVHTMTRGKASAVVLIPYIVGALVACGLTFALAQYIISAVHNIH